MYNREIAAQKAAFAFRNQLLTFGVLLVVVIVVWFLVITATLADPSQLWQRNRGEEYMRPYYQRRDVHAFLWAVGGTLVYYDLKQEAQRWARYSGCTLQNLTLEGA